MISIKASVDSVQKKLKETSASIPAITRKCLQLISRRASQEVKSGIRASTHVRTGQFLKAYTFHVKKDGLSATVYPRNYNSKNRQWAAGLSSILNYGTKDGRIKPRAFVERGERYLQYGVYEYDLQNIVDQEIKKMGW